MDGDFDKAHRCSYCDRRFRKSEHLTRHIRTHTKEKPFTCHCGSSFTRRDLLKRHTRLTHQDAECHHSSTDQSRTRDSDVVSPPPTLPIPPEYTNSGSTFLTAETDGHVLSQFDAFFSSSGLQQLATSLPATTASHNDSRGVSNIAATPSNANPGITAPASDPADANRRIDESNPLYHAPFGHLKVMDEAYSSLRSLFVEQASRSEVASCREQELLDRIKELEQILVSSGERLAAEAEKARGATKDANEWENRYERLRSTLQGALGPPP